MHNTLHVIIAGYRQHFFRSCLVISALVMAVAGLCCVLILNEAAKQSYQNATQPLVADVRYLITAKSPNSLSKADFADLRQQGFPQLVPVMIKRVTTDAAIHGRAHRLTLYGVDSFALLSLPLLQQGNNSFNPGGFNQLFSASGSLLIHRQFAKELGLIQGQSIHTRDNLVLPPLELVAEDHLGRELVADIGLVQQLFSSDKISQIWVVGDLRTGEYERLKRNLPDHLRLQSSFNQEDAQHLEDSFHLNVLAMALLMFAVCMFVVMNAFNLLFSQRVENFKILRQLGVHRYSMFAAICIELVLLCLVSTLGGFYLGQTCAQLLSPAVANTLENLYGAHISFIQTDMGKMILYCFLSSLSGALLAASYPLADLNKRLSNKSVNPTKLQRAPSKGWFICAVLCTGSGGLIYAFFQGLTASFIIIGCILLAGCAVILGLLPVTLRCLFNWFSPDRYIVRYCLANALLVSERSKIAFCAFFIAVAANIGMNLMVDSFRHATNGWLEQRLNASAYVFTDTPHQFKLWQQQHMPELELVPRIQTTGIMTQMYEVTLYFRPKGEKFEQAMVFEQHLDNHWQMFNQHKAIFVNQQLFYARGLSLGDEVSLSFNNQNLTQMVIAGVTLDYGNPNHQVILAQALLDDAQLHGRAYALFNANEMQIKELKTADSHSQVQVSIMETKDLLTLSMQTFDRTFVITDSLNIVTLLVAAFSLASSMLIMNLDDKPKQALMRSLGLSRRLLLLTTMAQYCGLALLVCLMAIPIGMMLSWLLINLVNLQAFYWRYPLLLDPNVLLTVLVTALLVVVSVLIFPLLKSGSKRLSEDIKWLS